MGKRDYVQIMLGKLCCDRVEPIGDKLGPIKPWTEAFEVDHKITSFMVTNINTMGTMNNFWGKFRSLKCYHGQLWWPATMHDKRFEVMSNTNICTALTVPFRTRCCGGGGYTRKGQTSHLNIPILEEVHVQQDGEAWKQSPGTFYLRYKLQLKCALGPLSPKGTEPEPISGISSLENA